MPKLDRERAENRDYLHTPVSAPQLWAELLYKQHPEITQVILGYYYAKSTRKEEIRRFEVEQLRQYCYLNDGTYPPPSISSAKNSDPLLCSISSIVGIGNVTPLTTPLTEKPQRRREYRLENPRSFVNLDFSCEVDDRNLGIISETLYDSPCDWYVLASGNSYHATLDTIVEPYQLPQIWGSLLAKFSQLSESRYVQEKGVKIAKSLQANSNSAMGLRLGTAILFNKAFREIAETSGYSEFSKFTFLDWGHLYHSLINLLGFYSGYSPGTGYLRISGKNAFPPPVLVAQRVDQQFKFFRTQPDRQPALF